MRGRGSIRRNVAAPTVSERGFVMPSDPTASTWLVRSRDDEAGEGVISTAIAVLIMALIGAAMWAVFSGVFSDSADMIEDQVGELQPIGE